LAAAFLPPAEVFAAALRPANVYDFDAAALLALAMIRCPADWVALK
jgi:hypothetical protein